MKIENIIPKKIASAIDKRRKFAERMNKYDGIIETYCEKNGISLAELETDYGCMITTEPLAYAHMTTEVIQKALRV